MAIETNIWQQQKLCDYISNKNNKDTNVNNLSDRTAQTLKLHIKAIMVLIYEIDKDINWEDTTWETWY